MSDATAAPAPEQADDAQNKMLFWACFISLIATAFGFVIRAMVIDDWGTEFNLTQTQKAEIFGVGLWPFAISIVLFSLIIDRIGYGTAMVFAFACHVISAIVTIFATGYWSLYFGTFIVALGNGTVEAVINPVVATLFNKEKTKWLNILHAGWPGGLVLGGLLGIAMADFHWQYKVGLILLPTVAYGILMLGKKFPVQERVAAGVSYKDMLAEIGGVGALLVLLLIFAELVKNFNTLAGTDLPWFTSIILAFAGAGAFGLYVKSIGRPLFIVLMLIMVPLATTELGTDSWITPLMEGQMKTLGLHALWVLVYTSFIMMVLRFYAGPIVHRLSPLGLLSASALIAAVGLVFLSKATGFSILLAATIYGVGKTFFWPTMLGVASELFPKGGALTLNTLGGVGMLGVGVVGSQFFGYIQDTRTVETLNKEHQELGKQVIAKEEKLSIFGMYTAIDNKAKGAIDFPVNLYERREEVLKDAGDKSDVEKAALLKKDGKYRDLVRNAYVSLVKPKDAAGATTYDSQLPALEKAGLILTEAEFKPLKEKAKTLDDVINTVKKGALATVAIFPTIMLLCYLGLMGYFKSQGGYQAEELAVHAAEGESETGGNEGPAEA